MVSSSTGAINSLLGKFTTLMGDEYAKLKGVRKEVASLEDEFRSIKAFLEKLEDMDNLDSQVKEWRNQVRELSYDIEDCIDDFMHQLAKSDASAGFVKKTARLLKKLRMRHQIASRIQKIKTRVQEATERRMRYKLDEYVPNPSYMPIDPRVVAIYAKAAGLVGIDSPRDELTKLLMVQDQELKVASIVGFGGLGKTTLASQVYHKLEGQYDCRAFVSVSQNPNLPKLLHQILLKITGQCFSHVDELGELLNNILCHLRDKWYFIIIDDLWESSSWNVIRCAFPENKYGSRILTTTRIYSVAISCCSNRREYIYKMRPLCMEDSRRLFFSRIFGPGEACPDKFEELSADILKRCGGLPLAIISIASLLADQSTRTWQYVKNSLGSMFEGNPTLEDMKQILDLSYRNLPHHLKSCLLYLGMYPEDSTVEKNDLVRQWMAEGFVRNTHGMDAEDVGGSYFNELINRSMIQPVDTDYNDEVLSCRVHDLMLDLIRFKSVEEGFFDIITDVKSTTGMHKKIRRLSLHYGGTGHGVIPATVKGSLSQVRSVVAFTSVLMPSFLGFKYVRVLLLEFRTNWMKIDNSSQRRREIDLTGMCELNLLRYLKIVCNTGMELPNQLWRLEYLETMILQPLRRLFIPSDVVLLTRLSHLIVPYGTEFQDGIGSMKSLRTLQTFDLSGCTVGKIKSLGELTNLRNLQLCCCSYPLEDEVMDALCSSLEKLSHSSTLKNLAIINPWFPYFHIDGLSTLSSFPRYLGKLDLKDCLFSRIPKWIAHLQNLDSLKLAVSEVVPKDDVHILAGMPSLVYLYLDTIVEHPQERFIFPGNDKAFPALKQLKFRCPKLFMAFEAGALPRLRKLELWFSAKGWEQGGDKWVPIGIEHLPTSLEEILVERNLDLADDCDVDLAGAALKSLFDTYHPGADLILANFWDHQLHASVDV